jgi:hypothetical protein
MMRVFERRGDTYEAGPEIEVGKDLFEVIEAIKIDRRRILASTLTWGRDDPHCCPSKHGRATFEVQNRELKRLAGK